MFVIRYKSHYRCVSKVSDIPKGWVKVNQADEARQNFPKVYR